ncbi:MOSC domain-containing protein [Longimicrobium sp.]|uniref:MOSC domain-containing protein n=1 Tax=Longimicrobium sp. TaxID=2029185 RepID=UPI002E354E75|nr:MOSC domain-containing protein [Longimicrobium sp.]HEX6042072.1 MOSC domain-containing protein [Longimicrobium sp.]
MEPNDAEDWMTGRIVSVNVGMPREHGTEGAAEPMERPWITGFFKDPIVGPVHVGATNLDGDGQADLRVHGGPDKAVLLYAASHYPDWRTELGFAMPFGAFGENLTVEGMAEGDVCIGDVFDVGTARLEVSQPRGPCWKIARRWKIRDLSARVQRTGRTGWYARVLREGTVQAGDTLTLVDRPNLGWTVTLASELLRPGNGREAEAAALAAVPALADAWRAVIEYRLAHGHIGSDEARLVGPNG